MQYFANFTNFREHKSGQENTDGPANNLKRKGVYFHRESANIGEIRDNFFLNRNDLPLKVKKKRNY